MTETKLRIATMNVHGWADSEWRSNIDRFMAAVREEKPDIVCLQEVTRRSHHALGGTGSVLENVAKRLGMHPSLERGQWGSAVLSRWPIETLIVDHPRDVDGQRPRGRGHVARKHRMVICRTKPFGRDELAMDVCALHLNHQYEPNRMQELDSFENAVGERGSVPRVVCGDFNALRRDDYTDAEWDEIARIRAQGHWEAPQVDVTERMCAVYDDVWASAGRRGKADSCRYNTRIDFIYASDEFSAKWRTQRCWIDWKRNLSDHAMVLADFVLHPAA